MELKRRFQKTIGISNNNNSIVKMFWDCRGVHAVLRIQKFKHKIII